MKQKISYAQVGDDYDTKDPIKKLAQNAAKSTAVNLKKYGFREITDSRGESAYVWSFDSARNRIVSGSAQDKSFDSTQDKQDFCLASVIEGLGTKNLVADAMLKITGKTYYDVIGHDTVATIINDLVTVGAIPLVIHAYWAIENNDWLQDRVRMRDLIGGWKSACDLAGVSWGGGETPTLKGIVVPDTVDLGGSATGIIRPKTNLITDKKLRAGDRILLLKSAGINANGLSLARAIAKKLSKGYATKLANGQMYGEEILHKTHIYAKLIQDLLTKKIDIHYISNITGHGLRKLMRARPSFSYVVERIIKPPSLFDFIQEKASLADFEMYQTFNMGMDYALFLPEREVKKAQIIIKKHGFDSLNAGYVEKGKKQVVIKPKNLVYDGSSLDLR